MVIHQLCFPKAIQDIILWDIIKNRLDITFNNGAVTMFDNSNIKVTKLHNIIFNDSKRCIIDYIIENDINKSMKSNIYINSINSETRVSLTSLIESVNKHFFPRVLKGHNIVRVFREEGISGAKAENRLQYQKMLKFIKQGKVNRVVGD